MRNKKELRERFLTKRTHNYKYSEKLLSRVGWFKWYTLDILGAAKVELAMREMEGDDQAGEALDALLLVTR